MVTPPPSPPSPPQPRLQPQEEQHLEPAALIPLDHHHHHHDHQSLDEHNVSLNNVSLVQRKLISKKGGGGSVWDLPRVEWRASTLLMWQTKNARTRSPVRHSATHTNTHTRKVTYRPKDTILTVCLLVFFMRWDQAHGSIFLHNFLCFYAKILRPVMMKNIYFSPSKMNNTRAPATRPPGGWCF